MSFREANAFISNVSFPALQARSQGILQQIMIEHCRNGEGGRRGLEALPITEGPQPCYLQSSFPQEGTTGLSISPTDCHLLATHTHTQISGHIRVFLFLPTVKLFLLLEHPLPSLASAKTLFTQPITGPAAEVSLPEGGLHGHPFDPIILCFPQSTHPYLAGTSTAPPGPEHQAVGAPLSYTHQALRKHLLTDLHILFRVNTEPRHPRITPLWPCGPRVIFNGVTFTLTGGRL